VMLLLHLGLKNAAALLTDCLNSALSESHTRTLDLAGSLGTQEFAAHVANLIRKDNR
jgi:isocitrate/isopropylmalate dehydrogenase